MTGIDNKRKSEKGMTLLEALVSTAIIGIGFVAVFQMVNYSVQSIDVSGERTKASYLVSMVAEDIISENDIWAVEHFDNYESWNLGISSM